MEEEVCYGRHSSGVYQLLGASQLQTHPLNRRLITQYQAETTKMTGMVAMAILMSVLAHDNNCTTLGLFANNPATSCNQIYQHVHE